jgi:uncharacterized protein
MRSLFIAFFAVLTISTVEARAASFDCRKAHSPDEIAVCNHLCAPLGAIFARRLNGWI